jgi:O-acetyl-ADP-ribose deacetylase (regulator of RNase III)
MAVSITLCDRSAEMVQAWKALFPEEAGIKIVNQNILTVAADTLVVPANAFGFTDGGVDIAVSGAIFNLGLQDRLQPMIAAEYAGELLVGQALVMPTPASHDRFRAIVVAPTMRVPEDVSGTVNAFLAMRAILLAVNAYNQRVQPADRIASIAVPGLCTGVGKMPAERAAYQMWIGYRTVALGDVEWSKTLEKQAGMHKKMRER